MSTPFSGSPLRGLATLFPTDGGPSSPHNIDVTSPLQLVADVAGLATYWSAVGASIGASDGWFRFGYQLENATASFVSEAFDMYELLGDTVGPSRSIWIYDLVVNAHATVGSISNAVGAIVEVLEEPYLGGSTAQHDGRPVFISTKKQGTTATRAYFIDEGRAARPFLLPRGDSMRLAVENDAAATTIMNRMAALIRILPRGCPPR